MSAWDDMNETPQKTTIDGEGDDAAGLDQNRDLSSIDDGFGNQGELPAAEDEVVENAAVKKKGLNPKLVAGLLGVVTLTLVGYGGLNLYNKMKPKRAAPPVAIEQGMTALPAGAPAPTLFDDPTTAGGAGASVAPAVVTPGAGAPVSPAASVVATAPTSLVAVAPQVAPAQTVPVVPVQPVAAVAPDPHLQQQVVDLDKRMTSLEDGVGKLTEAVSRSQSKPAVLKVAKDPAAEGSPVTRTKVRASKKHLLAKEKPAGLKEPESTQTQLALQLRGVYPPHGEDRQAWVLDPKTNVITIVTKGESIQGMSVVRVGSDYVLTNQGIIR